MDSPNKKYVEQVTTTKQQTKTFVIILLLIIIGAGFSVSVMLSLTLFKVSTQTEKPVYTPPETEREYSEDEQQIMDRLKDKNKWIIKLKDKPLVEYKKELESKNTDKGQIQSLIQNHKSQIESKQASVKNNLESKGLIIKRDFKNTFNGIAFEGTNLEGILDLDEVEAIYEDKEVQLFLDESVPLINADDVWLLQDPQGTFLTGEGMTIAIIDSGIDYTHADLGGCFGVECKVIGGYDFHNNDADPMDDNGHGTHVAATAAGKGDHNDNGIIELSEGEFYNGVAPDAKIYAYKAVSETGGGSFSNIIAAVDRAVDPNEDGNFSDHADVISMSLGAPGFPDDPVSQASDNAVDAGAVVIVAVGNSGQSGSFTIGSPGNARKVIGVGAGCKESQVRNYVDAYMVVRPISQITYPYIDLTNPFGTIIDSDAIENPQNMEFADQTYAILKDGLSSCPEGSNVLVEIESGRCSVMKESGGIDGAYPFVSWAVIDLDDEEGTNLNYIDFLASDFNDCGYSSCFPPTFFLVYATSSLSGDLTTWNYVDAVFIPEGQQDYVANVSFLEYFKKDPYGLCDTEVVEFSSQGPTTIGTAKPDVIAPGHVICAARYDNWEPSGSLPYDTCIDEQHVWLSGTSMAAPHVVGAAALIKQAHPYWSPEQIKNTLKGTSVDLGLDSLIQGAGRIDVLSAVETQNPYPTAELTTEDIFVESIVDIYGTAYSDDFNYYDLEYGIGKNPSEWFLITTSVASVKDNILGTIDFDSLLEKEISIRLTSYDNDNQQTQSNLLLLRRDDSWKQGWPQPIENDNVYLWFSPTYGDLDNDGNIEIIAGTPSLTGSMVYVWDVDGNVLPGWPQQVNFGGGSTPALGDVDGDGDLEIVYKSTSFVEFVAGETTLYVWNHDGTPLNSNWPKDLTYEIISLDSPVLEDIDNDGKDEVIIFNTVNEGIVIFNEDGSEVYGGWNSVSTSTTSDLSVGDINRDGQKEIVYLSGLEDKLYVWESTGEIMEGFPFALDSFSSAKVVLGDVDDDNYKDIVFITYVSGGCHLFVYDSYEKILKQSPVFYCTDSFSPILIDVDQDNDLEIVVVAFNYVDLGQSGDTRIYVLDHEGNFLEGILISEEGNAFSTSPVIYIDNQNHVNLFTVAGNPINFVKFDVNDFSLDWEKLIFNYSVLNGMVLSSPRTGMALGDVDKDGKLELIITIFSGDFLNYKDNTLGTRVFVIDLEDEGEVLWPMYKGNAKHTGCYDCDKPSGVCGDLDNSWSVDVSDLTYFVDYLFGGGAAPQDLEAANVNGDSGVDVSDLTYLVDYLFGGGADLQCAPVSGRGGDATKGWSKEDAENYIQSAQAGVKTEEIGEGKIIRSSSQRLLGLKLKEKQPFQSMVIQKPSSCSQTSNALPTVKKQLIQALSRQI